MATKRMEAYLATEGWKRFRTVRIGMAIEVSPGVQCIEDTFGVGHSTAVGIFTRLILWFANQGAECPVDMVNTIDKIFGYQGLADALIVDGVISIENGVAELVPDGTAFGFGPAVRGEARESIPKKLRFLVLRRDNYACQLCGRGKSDGVKLNVDHKTPRKRGGETTRENLWTLCWDCNIGKGTLALET